MANGRTSQQWSWMTAGGNPVAPGTLNEFDYEELARFFETFPKSTLLAHDGGVVSVAVDDSIAPALKALRIAIYDVYVNNTEELGISADHRHDFKEVTSPLLAALALVVLHNRPVNYGAPRHGKTQQVGALDRINIDFLRMLDDSLTPENKGAIPHGMKKLVRDSWDLIVKLARTITHPDAPSLQGNMTPVALSVQPVGFIQIDEQFDKLPDDIKRILSLVYFENTLVPLCKEIIGNELLRDLPDATRAYFSERALPHTQERLEAYGTLAQQRIAAIRELDLGVVS